MTQQNRPDAPAPETTGTQAQETPRARAPQTTGRTPSAWRLRRVLPLAMIAVGAVTAAVLLRDTLTFATLEAHYEELLAWRDAHFAASVAGFAALYIAVVAFSVPGAVWLTLLGGFLFGLWLGTGIVVLSATTGATLIFLAARTGLAAPLRARAGNWLQRIEAEFRRGEVSFLLIMRLIPAIPFFVANLAPAFLGVRLGTFFWTTLVGIVPGTMVYVSIGAGLGRQLALGEQPDLGVIFEPHILGPLLGLAALAALPMVIRRLRDPNR